MVWKILWMDCRSKSWYGNPKDGVQNPVDGHLDRICGVDFLWMVWKICGWNLKAHANQLGGMENLSIVWKICGWNFRPNSDQHSGVGSLWVEETYDIDPIQISHNVNNTTEI